MHLLSLLPTTLLLTLNVLAHEGGHQIPIVPADADWATRHMIEEHHLNGWDAETFFTLHDFKNAGSWSASDVRRMYGLYDASTAHVDEAHKASAVQHILDFYDADKNGEISKAEFVEGWRKGVKLPDLGYGPGHHGDDEYEYEIHHWEKYHGDDTKVEDLTHPEDIAHFKKHEEEDRKEELARQLEGQGVIESNIPKKYLRTD